MTSRKVLIGGGTGFIGNRLTAHLKKKGFYTQNITRKGDPKFMPESDKENAEPPKPAKPPEPPKTYGPKFPVSWNIGHLSQRLTDFLKQKAKEMVARKKDPNLTWSEIEDSGLPKNTFAVINLAGQQFLVPTKKWTPEFKEEVAHSRIETTSILAKAVKDAQDKPKVFILITGVGAYAPSKSACYDERSDIIEMDFFTKLVKKWEEAACVDPPVRKIIIRTGVVLGREGGMIKNMIVPFSLGLGGRIGSGEQYLPWIHIDDLVRLITFALETESVTGVLNAVSPNIITNNTFTKAFAKALGRPAFIPVPEFVLNMIFHKERAIVMTQGQKVIPQRVLDYGFKYKYGDINEACKEFAHLLPK